MANNSPQPEIESPRKIVVHLEWFPDKNQLQLAVTGGDPMQYRGMMVKGFYALNQIEAGQAQPNRVQLAPGPLPRQN